MALTLQMETSGVTEFTLQIGQIPANPGIQAVINLQIGDNNTQKLKEAVSHLTGHDFQPFHAYFAIQCTSAQAADHTKGHLQTFWNNALSGQAQDMVSSQLKQAVKPGDQSMAKVEFYTHSDKLVLKATLGDEKSEEVRGMYQGMVVAMAGHLLSHDQEFHFEIDIGKPVSAILHSGCFPVEAAESFKFNSKITIKPEIAGEIADLLQNFGMPDEQIRGIRMISMFDHARVGFNFRSANQLPEPMKEKIQEMASLVDFSMIRNGMPEEIRPLVEHMIANAQGDLHVIGGSDHVLIEAKIHAPGLSVFYQFNQGINGRKFSQPIAKFYVGFFQ